MSTLLHHIQTWMQKSIAEAEDRIDKRVAQQTERKIQAVHQRLDEFELRVLACPAPTIDLTTLKKVVMSLRAKFNGILHMRGHECETEPIELAEDTVLDALFTTLNALPPETREHAKRHCSSRTTKGEDAHSRKKERTDLEAARRALLINEETRQMTARELAAGASSSRL